MVREPESKGRKAGKVGAGKPRAKAGRLPATRRDDDQARWGDHASPGRARQGLPPKPSRVELDRHRADTGEAFIRREGVLTPEVFEEMLGLLFPSKRAFTEYTGISPAQVQRYCTGRQPVPRDVAILITCLAAQQRHGLPLPELSDITG